MIDTAGAEAFLSEKRLAVVGASDDPRNFGRSVYEELRTRGYDVAAVNRNATTVLGDVCYPSLASVPGPLDGVIVMVGRARAAAVVEECIEAGVPRVWLFKGIGKGAVSDAAVELCQTHGISVVAGACPFMFLAPVTGIHRFHRAVKRLSGVKSAA